MGKIIHVAGRKVLGVNKPSRFRVGILEHPSGVTVSSTTVTERDINVKLVTTTGAANDYQIVVSGAEPHTFISETPAVCRVDSSGAVSRITNGVGRIGITTAVGKSFVTRTHLSTGTIVKEFESWATGSLTKHILDAVAAMTLGKLPSNATQNMFTSAGGGTSAPAYTRNANIFSGSLDLTAISCVTDTTGTDRFPVVLISPRHIIAGHVGCPVGKNVVFLDSAGHCQTRKVTAQSVGFPAYGDNFVGLLDTPITTITPMSLLPANWTSYLPGINTLSLNGMQLPVLNKGWTAGDKLRIFYATRFDNRIYMREPSAGEAFFGWSTPQIGGDSNGPIIVPINGAPVLLHCLHATNFGEFYAEYLQKIDSLMLALGGGYTSTKANLAGFPSW